MLPRYGAWLIAIFVVVGLTGTGSDAHANKRRIPKVDWSEYLETPQDRARAAAKRQAKIDKNKKAKKTKKSAKASKKRFAKKQKAKKRNKRTRGKRR